MAALVLLWESLVYDICIIAFHCNVKIIAKNDCEYYLMCSYYFPPEFNLWNCNFEGSPSIPLSEASFFFHCMSWYSFHAVLWFPVVILVMFWRIVRSSCYYLDSNVCQSKAKKAFKQCDVHFGSYQGTLLMFWLREFHSLRWVELSPSNCDLLTSIYGNFN